MSRNKEQRCERAWLKSRAARSGFSSRPRLRSARRSRSTTLRRTTSCASCAQAIGDRVLLFNGKDGEWRAEIAEVEEARRRRSCAKRRPQPQTDVPDLWLAFAPIKKTPADYVAQKATELGVRVLQPVITQPHDRAPREHGAAAGPMRSRPPSNRGALSVPEIARAGRSGGAARVVAEGPAPRLLRRRRRRRADRRGARERERRRHMPGPCSPDPKAASILRNARRSALNAFVVPVTLGPRIMRADTAALAALAVWQAARRRLAAAACKCHGGSVGSRRRQHRAD